MVGYGVGVGVGGGVEVGVGASRWAAMQRGNWTGLVWAGVGGGGGGVGLCGVMCGEVQNAVTMERIRGDSQTAPPVVAASSTAC